MKIHWKLLGLFLALLIAFAAVVSIALRYLGLEAWWAGLAIGIAFGFFYPPRWSWVEFP